MFTCGEIFITSWYVLGATELTSGLPGPTPLSLECDRSFGRTLYCVADTWGHSFRLYRYLRLIVHCFSHWTFRPIPLPENPCLTSEDVTVIIPTINGNTPQFRETLRSILLTKPHNILLVTIDANLKSLAELARDASSECIQVFSVTHANKRRQMCRAIPEVTTKITVLADDDVTWPPNILHWLLAPLEMADIGGVGPSQRLHRPEKPNLWDFLGAVYLERRNFEMSATTHLDGGISCLSGRTAAYRSQILQDPAFMANFTNEFWRGKYHLNADDDNFITRWLVAHGWRTQIQYSDEAELLTTLEGNPKFLKQCLRWSRSNWRSNLKSMFSEKHIWRSVGSHLLSSSILRFLVEACRRHVPRHN